MQGSSIKALKSYPPFDLGDEGCSRAACDELRVSSAARQGNDEERGKRQRKRGREERKREKERVSCLLYFIFTPGIPLARAVYAYVRGRIFLPRSTR